MQVAAYLEERLAQGPLLLSGAVGTELRRRGVPTPLPLWSTAALLESPDAVRQLHADYVRAGAEIVTANTFRTGRATVAPRGHDARTLTKTAVELARRGIEDAAPDRRVLVAGSVGPVADCYRPELVPDETTLRVEHGLHVGALVAARVDFVLVETMNTIREAQAALGAARAGLVPAMVSFVIDDDATLLSGEPLAEAAAAVEPLAPLAILVNCCSPEAAAKAVAILATATARPCGAYANGPGRPDDTEGWSFDGADGDEQEAAARYARHVDAWVGHGARIVGGCCGTSPAFIEALARTR